jgi:hypothetical protein
MNKTNYATDRVPALEYDEETEEFTISLDDVDDVMYSHRISPIVRRFFEYEILVRRKEIHDSDRRSITKYEIAGFTVLDEEGPYTFDLEWLEEASQWIAEEYE